MKEKQFTRKNIDLEGRPDEKGTFAYRATLVAAKAGKPLKNYIQDLVKKDVEKQEQKERL